MNTNADSVRYACLTAMIGAILAVSVLTNKEKKVGWSLPGYHENPTRRPLTPVT